MLEGRERVIVRCILDQVDSRHGLDSSPISDCCVYGNESLGALKNEKFCYLRD